MKIKKYLFLSIVLVSLFLISACSNEMPTNSEVNNTSSTKTEKIEETGKTVDENNYISSDEFILHNSTEDCYVTTDGFVYDITTFLDEHPKPLDAYCGELKDFTDAFRGQHMNDKDDKIKGFLIGVLK